MSETKNETKPTSNESLVKKNSSGLPVGRSASVASLFGVTPFNLMRRLTDDMEKMFEDLNGFAPTSFFDADFNFPAEFQSSMWSPKIEVLENSGEFTVKAELPGLKKEDINVVVKTI